MGRPRSTKAAVWVVHSHGETYVPAGWPKVTAEQLSELPPAQAAKTPSQGGGRRL